MTDQGTVINGNPALILKVTPTVKENMISNRNIFPAVRIKGRKNTQCIINRLSC